MLNKILAGALALGLVGSVAYAADDQAPAQPQAQAQTQAQAQDDAGPDGVQQGWWHRHMAGHRHDMRGEMREPGGSRHDDGQAGLPPAAWPQC